MIRADLAGTRPCNKRRIVHSHSTRVNLHMHEFCIGVAELRALALVHPKQCFFLPRGLWRVCGPRLMISGAFVSLRLAGLSLCQLDLEQ